MPRHAFDPTILRDHDLCGVVDETLRPADAWALGAAFGTMVRERGGSTVVVGEDGRSSSPALASALTRGLVSTGTDVVTVGLGPTPMLYFADRHFGADGSIMVTGSHNPSGYNGFKLVANGRTLQGDSIRKLAEIARQGAYVRGSGQVRCRPVLDLYVDRLLGDAALGRKLRVAWDAGSGAVGPALVRLCRRLPGEHILLNETVDGTFPGHHPDPSEPANLVELRTVVRTKHCDLGIAFDGDGDRIGVVDGEGRILWNDQLLLLLAEEVLRQQPGATIIADVHASQGVFERITHLGGKPLMWRTGHALVQAKMLETGSPLGGEMSGHLFFADRYHGYGDGLYAAIRLLNLVTQAEFSMAELRDRLPESWSTPELRIPCPEERKREVMARVRDHAAAQLADADLVDGVRVKNDDGWWLLRASNTRDMLVGRCEGHSSAALARLCATVADCLKRCGLDGAELSGLVPHLTGSPAPAAA